MLIKRLPNRELPTEPTPNFGQLIAQVRRECGLSQSELAKLIGFETATALSLIEAGKRRLSVDTLFRVAVVCDTSFDIKPVRTAPKKPQETKS